MSSFREDNMVYEIKKLLTYIKDPEYSEEISDGEMLDHVISKLEYLLEP
tara:strand:- start:155 stop:301 length:147 start_codon:yes stop_codon:yes gene_type:complete